MKNSWKEYEANQYINEYKLKKISKDLALRIYSTHLLGKNPELVLHGGGNTSVKSIAKDAFGKEKSVIYVKGSGWDMSNLNEIGMPGMYLDPLIKTLSLKKLSDEKMVNYLRSNLLDSNSPNPSVETLLHAYLPFKYVDHTHSNAILSLVNLNNSREILKKVFKDKVSIVPYVMPGFDLAKLCQKIISKNKKIEGLILLNHGIFSFGHTAKESYNRMIKLVSLAENFINNRKKIIKFNNFKKKYNLNRIQLKIRNYFYLSTGKKWIIRLNNNPDDIAFTNRKDLQSLFNKGPVTPDHVIRIKSSPLVILNKDLSSDLKIINLIDKYINNYKNYFKKYKDNIKKAKIADPLPRIIILQGLGFLSIGSNKKEMLVSYDIFNAMKNVIINSVSVSKFKSINNKEIFKMEYWPLERAKLNKKISKKFDGNVAIITGGAGIIGSAIAKKFINEDIEVVLFDKDFSNLDVNILKSCHTIKCDLTNNAQINKSLDQVLKLYGGVDILIANSGAAFEGGMINVQREIIEKSMEINFYSHHNIIQKIANIMVTQDIGGSISLNLSKQSINPGKNFGPYGVAKASSLFFMKQYALEFGNYNIRVNGINADRIKSGLLTNEFIKQRAKSRKMTPFQYLNNNLLKKQVKPEDVAEAFFAQLSFEKTTGNIITVDGGNIEASLR